jgi:hypothetical protein
MGRSRLFTLPRDYSLTTSSSRSRRPSPLFLTAGAVEHRFAVKACTTILKLALNSAPSSGIVSSTSKLCCALDKTFVLGSYKKRL